MERGLFGRRFDFNRDGKMSAFERAAEYQFFYEFVMADEAEDALASAGHD